MLENEKKQRLSLALGTSAYAAMLTEVDIAGGHSFIFSSPDTLLSHMLCYLAAADAAAGKADMSDRKCRRIFGGSCLDIIDKAEEKVMTEDIDGVLEGCGYAPYELPYKFYFLNFSERNDSAQNKLLKTLEEPPTSAKFIIITSSLSALLPTVISRCAVFQPRLREDELLGLEDEFNPNLSCAKYAARGNMTEFFGLLTGKNVEYLSCALSIARGIGKSQDMARLLKYLPAGGSGARQRIKKTLGYLELIYGDVMKAHAGLRVDTFGLFDPGALAERLAMGGMSESLSAIRHASMRSDGGNLSSVADELIIKLTEVNYNAKSSGN